MHDVVDSEKVLSQPTLLAVAASNNDLQTVKLLLPHYSCPLGCPYSSLPGSTNVAADQALTFALTGEGKHAEVIQYLTETSSDLFVSVIVAIKLAQNGQLDRPTALRIFSKEPTNFFLLMTPWNLTE